MNLLKPTLRTHIRWTIHRDMNEIMNIENSCCLSPWTEEQFLSCMRQRNIIFMTVESYVLANGGRERHGPESESSIVGYFGYELGKKSLEVIRLMVHPGYRRQGVASAMLSKLKSKLTPCRRTGLQIDVPEEELASQLLLKSHDFLATRIIEQDEKTYYRFKYKLDE